MKSIILLAAFSLSTIITYAADQQKREITVIIGEAVQNPRDAVFINPLHDDRPYVISERTVKIPVVLPADWNSHSQYAASTVKIANAIKALEGVEGHVIGINRGGIVIFRVRSQKKIADTPHAQ